MENVANFKKHLQWMATAVEKKLQIISTIGPILFSKMTKNERERELCQSWNINV